MSTAGFIRKMFLFSVNRLSRDKHSVVTELLELLVPLVLFYGLFRASFFDETGVIKVTLLLLVAIAIGTGSRLGIDLVGYRNQGFLREIYSSPLSTGVKIAGLLAEPFVVGLTRTLVALVLIVVMGFNVTLIQAVAIALIEALAMVFSALIILPISVRLSAHGMLNILMWLISFSQFGISGLLIPASEQPVIALNPFSYPVDMLLHVSNLTPNYPFVIDVFVSFMVLVLAFLAARHTIYHLEV